MPPTHSIAFYNLENLFDCEPKGSQGDKDFTPEGYYRWDQKRYLKKIGNLARVISCIGNGTGEMPPAFLGVCEVGSEKCLVDLKHTHHLAAFDYDHVYFRSPDRRGMAVGFLYRKQAFRLLESKAFQVPMESQEIQDTTRDILYIKGELFHIPVHVLVNHWPSRMDGTRATKGRRKQAGEVARKIVAEIYDENPESNIMLLGDFNDHPKSSSLRQNFSEDFVNLMTPFHEKKKGSVKFKGRWLAFDQILLNHNLLSEPGLQFGEALIFDPPFITQQSGRFRGTPKRTFIGRNFQNGYSDHFPVYVPFELIDRDTA